MGGKSSGRLSFLDGYMEFSGVIDLDGGGFSSVRRRFSDGGHDLSRYAGVVVTVEADDVVPGSVPLGVHLQFDDSVSQYSFSSAFAVPLSDGSGEEASVFLPMDSFDRGSWIGYQCTDCALDITKIVGMDVYVLFQEGPFEVRIKSVTALAEAASFPSPAVSFDSTDDVVSILEATIYSGGSLYDKSYRELCFALYWSTLSTLVASPAGVPEAVKAVACAGLREAMRQDGKAERAWALRHTMDAILADVQGLERMERTAENTWLPALEELAAAATNKASACTGTTSPSELMVDLDDGSDPIMAMDPSEDKAAKVETDAVMGTSGAVALSAPVLGSSLAVLGTLGTMLCLF